MLTVSRQIAIKIRSKGISPEKWDRAVLEEQVLSVGGDPATDITEDGPAPAAPAAPAVEESGPLSKLFGSDEPEEEEEAKDED